MATEHRNFAAKESVQAVTPRKCCSQECAALCFQSVEVGWLSTWTIDNAMGAVRSVRPISHCTEGRTGSITVRWLCWVWKQPCHNEPHGVVHSRSMGNKARHSNSLSVWFKYSVSITRSWESESLPGVKQGHKFRDCPV